VDEPEARPPGRLPPDKRSHRASLPADTPIFHFISWKKET
jgi:hypothetical protein